MTDVGEQWISFKPEVRLDGVRPETLEAMATAARIFKTHEAAFVVTSVRDGRHMVGSLHYKGFAFDFRTHHLREETALAIFSELEVALGPDYDVLHEDIGTQNAHGHAEYDPKV